MRAAGTGNNQHENNGGGVETPDKSTYLNAFAAVKSAAETCGVCSIKIGMVAKNQ